MKKKSDAIKIKVKAKPLKIQRVASGIPNFDRLVEGGFWQRSTNLLVGGPGTAKTIFATQFLIEGLKRGENCMYVTFEEKKDQFFANMLRFGWDLKKYESSGKFVFLEYTPLKVKNMLEEGGGSIESVILSKKVARLVIDSVSSFILLFDNELERREAALALFNMIKNWNCTSVLTLEEEQVTSEKTPTKAIEFESDGIIISHYLRVKDKRQRYLEILKMKGTKHAESVYKFDITPKGIKVGTAAVKNFKDSLNP